MFRTFESSAEVGTAITSTHCSNSCIAFTFEGKSLICTGTRGGLVCVDAENGKLMWSNAFLRGQHGQLPHAGLLRWLRVLGQVPGILLQRGTP